MFVCLFFTGLDRVEYDFGFTVLYRVFMGFSEFYGLFLSRIFSVLNPTITLMDGADSRRK